MYFDTHAHYDSENFSSDRDALLTSMPGSGVSYIVDPGCDGESSRLAVELSKKYPFVYAAVGWHPEEWESWTGESLGLIRALAAEEKTVAIGEIGLDYYWDREHKDIQKEMLRAQLALARELDMPVVIHDREAHGDCLEITGEFPELSYVFHCFSGSAEMAEILIKRGCYLGFDGPITYQNNQKAGDIIALCPLERILIETDSPYLSPQPRRGKRNDSTNLPYIAAKIAEEKGLTTQEVARQTTENAKRFYRL